MRVLYIGGTGEISWSCVHAAVAAGQEVTVFNRGNRAEPLPDKVEQITGDMTDEAAYTKLAERNFDVVCQFLAFNMERIERDLATFAGYTSQYIFISSASAYQKPPRDHRITEDTPMRNPYWPYSQAKADMETRLMQAHEDGTLPVTIIRPSQTHRSRFPGTCVGGDHWAWRMQQGKPIIIHGDGQSLWTITHSEDFARAFVRLCGNAKALGEAFHITRDRAHTWDRIFDAMAQILGVDYQRVYVPSRTLIKFNEKWTGPLLGDKSNSVVFDMSKVRGVIGPWQCEMTFEEGLERAAEHVKKRLETFEPDLDAEAMIDKIIDQQQAIGQPSGGPRHGS